MRRFLAILLVCALAPGVCALAEDASRFAGKWEMTELVIAERVFNPALLGLAFEITLNADFTLDGYFSQSGGISGAWTATADSVVIAYEGVPETLQYDGAALCFTQDGVMMRLTRASADTGVAGVWALTEAELKGVRTSAAQLGVDATLTLNADGSVIPGSSLIDAAEAASGYWTQNGNIVTITLDDMPKDFTFDGATLVNEENGDKMIFSRVNGEQPDLTDEFVGAEIDDFIGTWSAYKLEMFGASLPVARYGDCMTFAFDGETYSLVDKRTERFVNSAAFSMDGSALVIEDNTYMRLHADGDMSMTFEIEGVEAVFWFVREE